MAKLTRCPAGHVYDREAHEACPECARLGVVNPASERAAPDSATAGSAIPKAWLAIGGAGAALLLLAGYFVLGSNAAISDPKTAAADTDYAACQSDSATVADCDRAISSKKFSGPALGGLYRFRGFVRQHQAKPDEEGAITDFGHAIELEHEKFAAAFMRGNLYSQHGRDRDALADYDLALKFKQREDVYNNRADILRRSGEIDRAIADLDDAIRLDPKYFHAYWTRGLAWTDKGDKEKAAQDFKAALALAPPAAIKQKIEKSLAQLGSDAAPPSKGGPQDPAPAAATGTAQPAKVNLADLCSKEQGDKALAACDLLIASGNVQGPSLAKLHIIRGVQRYKKSNNDGAIEDFTEGLKLDPGNPIALTNRGAAYAAKNELAQALQDLDDAVKADPKKHEAYYWRGKVQLDKGNFDAAIGDFDRAIALQADHLWSHKYRGDAYRRKGDKEHAIADYRKALTLSPDAEFKKQIDAALYVLAPAVEHAAPAKQAETEKKTDGAAPPKSAVGKLEPKKLKTAQEVADDPDFKACLNAGKDIAACDRAISSGTFSNLALSMLHNSKALGFMRDSNSESARGELDEAIRLAPDSPWAYANRAHLRAEDNNLDGAIEDASAAIKLNPDVAPPFLVRRDAYWKKRDFPHAVADATKVIELEPKNSNHYLMRGLYYRVNHDYEHALADLNKALTLDPSAQDKTNIHNLLEGIRQEQSPKSEKHGAANPDDANSALAHSMGGGAREATEVGKELNGIADTESASPLDRR